MKLFRSRGANDAPQATTSPLARVNALFEKGRYAEAEAEARALAANDSRYKALALSVAARSVGAQGRHDEALAEYDALLPVFGRGLGAEHPQTLALRSNRAQTLTALARHAECEAECAAVARTAARGTRPDSALIAAAARVGQIYAVNAQGRHTEAEALAREALAGHRTSDRITVALRLGLTRTLNAQGRHEEALREAESTEELSRSLSEDQRHQEAGAVDLALATALLGLGRDAEAGPRARAAHDACVSAFGPGHYRTAEARALLDRLDGT
ncbi:tetratricopeptide repeat protein [Streptomyces gilvus]|uniref:tetratricopeptide repeat protein n=1 Tax=Streptomyces gilvus TaxID=2920937 RepID=UPI001F0F55EE|nr:tetratricopeptide repeat protein [Streptomyces sp. CME 23]MCH5673398.1 tetratricopeptide repeat protein [Streptomyces sp. CME 23]